MFIAPAKLKARALVRQSAFTLLEIVLAVCILGLMAVAIYRFVATNIVAMRISDQVSSADARYTGFENLLETQLQSLPPGQGTLKGDPYKFSGRSRDEMTWLCGAGPGLFTRYASGDYDVTLRLRPIPRSNLMELGVARESITDTSETVQANPAWVPLMEDVRSMEIRYFDPRLNAWVDRWSDASTLPHLVRLKVERGGASVPWEAVIPLRRTPL